MIAAAHATWYLLGRHVRASLRMPFYLLISIVQPILWVVLFGQLFSVVTEIPGFADDSYVHFLAPGIAIMTALFSSAYSGMGLLADVDRGVLDRMLATPAPRSALIAARVLHSGLQVLLQAGIILAVSAAMGARPAGAYGVGLVLLAASLLGAAFAALSNALALVAGRHEVVIAVMNFTALPMTFLSGMIMAPQLMPGWILVAAQFNPVHWAVTAARIGFEGAGGDGLAWNLALLTAFAAASLALATRAFRGYLRRG